MRKIFITIVICLIIFPVYAFAYKLLQPLPGITEVSGGQGFSKYLSWIFKFALIAAAFLAVIQIVIAGVEMVGSAASEKARGDAEQRIRDAVLGLLLAFGAWLILYTINPDLVKMELNIPDINIKAVSVDSPAIAGNLDYNSIPVEDRKFNIKSGTSGACKGGLANCSFKPEMVDKLGALADQLERMGISRHEWQVTEAYPPTSEHLDKCHNSATCIDIALIEKVTNFNKDQMAQKVKKIKQATTQVGFNATVDEYSSLGGKTTKYTTGDHLHIEL